MKTTTYAIGKVICEESNHGHSKKNIRVRIYLLKKYPHPYEKQEGYQPVEFIIGNYEEYKSDINYRMNTNDTYALFRFNPKDKFAFYVPVEKIVDVKIE
jgi:hypothetical protein